MHVYSYGNPFPDFPGIKEISKSDLTTVKEKDIILLHHEKTIKVAISCKIWFVDTTDGHYKIYDSTCCHYFFLDRIDDVITHLKTVKKYPKNECYIYKKSPLALQAKLNSVKDFSIVASPSKIRCHGDLPPVSMYQFVIKAINPL